MKKNYVLVDYENAPVNSLALLGSEQFRVTVFLGPHNTRLPIELVLTMQELADRATYIVLDTHGKNALDFHIAYYLGVLATADPDGFFHIISKDTGFDPLINHLKSRKVPCTRSISIEEMPCFKRVPQTNTVTTNSSPTIELTPKEVTPKPVAGRATVEDLIKLAVIDLINRKASKPRTQKTLRSTIYAKCGKETPTKDIDAVYEALVKRGYVKINGSKVSYALPATYTPPSKATPEKT